MKVDAVFFDLDNTLYDYERAFRLAALQSFTELWKEGNITGGQQAPNNGSGALNLAVTGSGESMKTVNFHGLLIRKRDFYTL